MWNKLMIGASMFGLLGTAAVPTGEASYVQLALQLGVAGICGGLLYYCLTHTIPTLSKNHSEAVEKLATTHTAACTKLADCHTASCDKLAGKIEDGNKEVSSLLRQALFDKDTKGIT